MCGDPSVSSSSPAYGPWEPSSQSVLHMSQSTDRPNQPPSSPVSQGKPTVASKTNMLPGSLYVQDPSFWTSLSVSVSWMQRLLLCGPGYIRQGIQDVGKAGFCLYISKDVSGIWWPKSLASPLEGPGNTVRHRHRLWSRGDGLN